jgi:lipopolysaccharide transport system ATP-binding protein
MDIEKTVLKVENVSKSYRLGNVNLNTFVDDLKNIYKSKKHPIKKTDISENDRTKVAESKFVWALKDVNFDLQQGEIVGIVGKNGAGKSTILKLISQVTAPSSGKIKIKGKIASLLEVGTGFHPELTGRENIFLNGAILGMSKNEITSKFDEIVEFAGVKKYVDTPVKRYSSGMYVRLAFAVAAHLEPDILIVDEVLAVGDIEFQKKAIGKMKEVSGQGGRTVLFVSHNMGSLLELCDRGVFMENGTVRSIGNISDIVSEYQNAFKSEVQTNDLSLIKNREGNGQIKFESIDFQNSQGKSIQSLLSGQDVNIVLKLKVNKKRDFEKIHISLKFLDLKGNYLFNINNTDCLGKDLTLAYDETQLTLKINISKLPLNTGNYTFNLLCSDYQTVFDEIHSVNNLSVDKGNFYKSSRLPNKEFGPFLIENSWSINKI